MYRINKQDSIIPEIIVSKIFHLQLLVTGTPTIQFYLPFIYLWCWGWNPGPCARWENAASLSYTLGLYAQCTFRDLHRTTEIQIERPLTILTLGWQATSGRLSLVKTRLVSLGGKTLTEARFPPFEARGAGTGRALPGRVATPPRAPDTRFTSPVPEVRLRFPAQPGSRNPQGPRRKRCRRRPGPQVALPERGAAWSAGPADPGPPRRGEGSSIFSRPAPGST